MYLDVYKVINREMTYVLKHRHMLSAKLLELNSIFTQSSTFYND